MKKIIKGLKRKRRIRAKISGTGQIPRVSVFRSNKYLYIQAIDDQKGNTLAAVTDKTSKDFVADFVEQLKTKKIAKIIFDRAGYRYHGKVQEMAENLRKNGLEF